MTNPSASSMIPGGLWSGLVVAARQSSSVLMHVSRWFCRGDLLWHMGPSMRLYGMTRTCCVGLSDSMSAGSSQQTTQIYYTKRCALSKRKSRAAWGCFSYQRWYRRAKRLERQSMRQPGRLRKKLKKK
eukprot:691866-Prymnesium_polylepis.1